MKVLYNTLTKTRDIAKKCIPVLLVLSLAGFGAYGWFVMLTTAPAVAAFTALTLIMAVIVAYGSKMIEDQRKLLDAVERIDAALCGTDGSGD